MSQVTRTWKRKAISRDHEYESHEGCKRLAEVSKKWFRIADTYGVDIVAVADDVLILAITVVIDMMVDPGSLLFLRSDHS
jgi:uncharacterized protein YxjI